VISITHISFGILFSEFILTSLGVEPSTKVLAASGIGALLPDIDTPKASLGRLFPFSALIEHRYGHRQITHSWIFICIMLVLLSPFLMFKMWFVYAGFIIGVVSHIMIDMANPSGVPFFYPNPARFVFPEHKASRIEVGSKKEFVLLCVLIFFVAISTPLSFIGYKSLFYRLAQTPYGAIEETKKHINLCRISVHLKGIWSHSQMPVEGEFNVLAVKEDGLIILDDKLKAYFLSCGPYTSIIINKISVIKNEKIEKEVIKKQFSYCLLDQIDIPENSIISGHIFYEGYENIKDILFSFGEEEYKLIRSGGQKLNKLTLSYCPVEFLDKLKNRGLFVSHADLTITHYKEIEE